ncbi:MAG: hypothetical protein QOE61_636 [Micromonosporaceae bacterium]|jgi:hypothetical protein|nr:hypothetical protein [Micromonosporaceae bacterium]
MVTQIQGEGTSVDGMCPLTSSGWRDLNPRPLRPERGAGVITAGGNPADVRSFPW